MSGIAGVFGRDGHAVGASSTLSFDGRLDNRDDLIRHRLSQMFKATRKTVYDDVLPLPRLEDAADRVRRGRVLIIVSPTTQPSTQPATPPAVEPATEAAFTPERQRVERAGLTSTGEDRGNDVHGRWRHQLHPWRWSPFGDIITFDHELITPQ